MIEDEKKLNGSKAQANNIDQIKNYIGKIKDKNEDLKGKVAQKIL